jgi:hypothetical protein
MCKKIQISVLGLKVLRLMDGIFPLIDHNLHNKMYSIQY